MSDIFNLIISI